MTKTTGEDQALLDGSMTLRLSIFSTSCFSMSRFPIGCRLGGCLHGAATPVVYSVLDSVCTANIIL